ncbi:MAG: replicative DNA helicase, partial [Candidatus Babeliales bacterium]
HNYEAERAVLGTILLNDESFGPIAELLVPSDFYTIAHQLIFKAMQDVIDTFKRIDLLTLQNKLEKNNELEKVGGVAYLISLQEEIHSVGFTMQHAEIIKEKAVLRMLIQTATQIVSSCYKQEERTVEHILDEAERTIFNISTKHSTQHFIQLNIWLKKTFQHLSSVKFDARGITGIPTGYKKLDEMLSGFQNGDFIILAGRPSMGKTAFLLPVAAQAAVNGLSVGFFSLEMAAEQLILRLLSAYTHIDHHNIRNATITSDEWIELTNMAAQLAELKFFIDDTPLLNLTELRRKARKLKAEHGLDFLVIDYLQLIHSTQRHENKHQEISEISRSLKALAKELNIPILVASQLSRAVESRMDKRPILSDLKGSGNIEQDGDVILLLYRDIVYNPDADPSLAELNVGKQRNGPTGTVYLNFEKNLTKFVDIDE